MFVVANMRSEKDIRVYGRPITYGGILYALRQYGSAEYTQEGTPKVNIELLRQDHPKNLRYVMFYRYFKDQRSQIKINMSEYEIFYESSDWIVYDLNIGK